MQTPVQTAVITAVERVVAHVAPSGQQPEAAEAQMTACLRVVYRLLFVELARRRGATVTADEAVEALELRGLSRQLTGVVLDDVLAVLASSETPLEPVHALGAVHEAMLSHRWVSDGEQLRLKATSDAGRKRAGSYFTPAPLVGWLLDHTLEATLDDGSASPTVCDPSCGAGAFLVEALRRLKARGLRPLEVIGRLTGVDTDGAALEVARTCLWLELVEPGRPAPMPELALHADDALLGEWESRIPSGGFDVVVGNPPFLNQLERLTANRPSVARALNSRSEGVLRPYTDISAVFLDRAATWVRPGGRVGLVQPQSLLGARDAAGVRGRLARCCALEALWASEEPVFDAHVLTCAPVLRRGAVQGSVRRFHGPSFEEIAAGHDPELSDGWSYLLAPGLGIPEVALTRGAGVVADVAECTADFRDQYYGLAPYVHEADEAPSRNTAPLVTSGLIDPAELRWGHVPTRFLKRRWEAPVVDLDALRDHDKLHRWATRRLVPKVLVGTQGKVIEAVADEEGKLLPSVPTITVVPAAHQLWHVLAVLLAPPVAAHAAAMFAGTALSMRAIKLSARQVAQLPLPSDRSTWDLGAAAVRRAQREPSRRREHLAETARHMCAAYGDDSALDWWLDRA